MLNIINHQKDASQNHNEISTHPVRKTIIKKIRSVASDVEKRKPCCTANGNVNCSNNDKKQYKDSSKKLKIELPYYPAILL